MNMQSTYLNRGYQQMSAGEEMKDHLITIRVIMAAHINQQTKQLQVGTGRKSKDSTFTFQAEFFSVAGGRGIRNMRFTVIGSLADRMVRDAVKPGTQLKVDAQFACHLNSSAMLDRSPFWVITYYEVVKPQNETGMHVVELPTAEKAGL